MEIDPLADTAPPRYAIESDEEDEYNPLSTSKAESTGEAIVKIQGTIPTRRAVIIVTGSAAVVWTKGAGLGEHIGAVTFNGVQVGLLFSPSWTKAIVLVSETTTRLPSWAMYKYAEYIVDFLKPTCVALLDTYPVHVYITDEPLPYHQAPARYLRSGTASVPVGLPAFAPPNMIASTSASFLSISSLRSMSNPPPPFLFDCTAILLPSSHIPPRPPRNISSGSVSLDDYAEWSPQIIVSAQESLFSVVGEQGQSKWEPNSDRECTYNLLQKKGDIGEGGMYI